VTNAQAGEVEPPCTTSPAWALVTMT